MIYTSDRMSLPRSIERIFISEELEDSIKNFHPTDGTSEPFTQFTINPDIRSVSRFVKEGENQIRLYQAIRDRSQDISDKWQGVIAGITAYLLPVLYAVLRCPIVPAVGSSPSNSPSQWQRTRARSSIIAAAVIPVFHAIQNRRLCRILALTTLHTVSRRSLASLLEFLGDHPHERFAKRHIEVELVPQLRSGRALLLHQGRKQRRFIDRTGAFLGSLGESHIRSPALANAARAANTFGAINFADFGSPKAGSESTHTQGRTAQPTETATAEAFKLSLCTEHSIIGHFPNGAPTGDRGEYVQPRTYSR
jgi:hypothetical protein